jgi:hypothetical protein
MKNLAARDRAHDLFSTKVLKDSDTTKLIQSHSGDWRSFAHRIAPPIGFFLTW